MAMKAAVGFFKGCKNVAVRARATEGLPQGNLYGNYQVNFYGGCYKVPAFGV